MKRGKKILSLVLVVIMCLGTLPMTDLGLEASAATQSTVKITSSGQVVDTFNGVQAMYIPETGNSDNDTTYSCAAYVKRFYSSVYGVDVWNLLTGKTPLAGSGSFSVTSSPQPGDIGYQTNSGGFGHWFIIKEVNSNGTYSIIEQNWKWASGGATYCYINRNVSYSSTPNFKVFRWSEAPSGGVLGTVDDCNGGVNTVYIRGWAFDPDSTSSQLNIHVYIGNERHVDIYANTNRPDVNDYYGCGNYHGFEKTITTSLTGTQTVKVYAINSTGLGNSLIYTGTVNISTIPTYYVDVNMNIDGQYSGSGSDGFTFDFYVDESQVDDDVKDCWRSVESGSTYTIEDIKCPSDYVFTGGEISGTITGEKAITLNFAKTYYLDVNVVINGISKDYGVSGFSFDVYHDGTLVSDDVTDHYQSVIKGTAYQIRDIRYPTGYKLTSATTSGTVNAKTTALLYFECTHPSTELKNAKAATCTATGYTGDTYCKTCGTKLLSGTTIAKKEHSYAYRAYAGTCISEGKSGTMCICGDGATRTIPKNPNNHEGGTEIRDAQTATCSAVGYTGDTYCKGCSVKLSLGTTIAKNSENHTGGTEIRNAQTATCTAEGYTGDTYCKGCSTKISSGTTIAKKAHDYALTTIAATCEKEGSTTYTCSCGASYSEEIAKNINNHTGDTEVRNSYRATCTSEGYTGDTYCKGCSVKLFSGSTVDKTVHSYEVEFVDPTCEKEGSIIYTCSCGVSYIEAIAKNAHSIVIDKAVSATCTKTGLTEGKRCSVCGTVIVAQQTVAKKAHTEVIDKAVSATCTKTGLTEGKHCSVCGTVIVTQKTVAAKGHKDANGDYKCDSGCGYEYEKPADHKPSDPTNNCGCNCHKGGIAGFFFKIMLFFQKLFKTNKVCNCGVAHY